MYFDSDFVHLAIRRLKKSDWVQMMCLKATADFYGWSRIFPNIVDAKAVDYPDGVRPWPSALSGRNYPARRYRICRDKTHASGYPKGLTNCFRLSNNARGLDLVAVAHAIDVDYGWMEDRRGKRVMKRHWDSMSLPDSYCQQDLTAAEF